MTVIHINAARFDDRGVYVGRWNRGYFGSPIHLGHRCPECGERHSKAGETLPCFRVAADRRIEGDPEYRERIKTLHGKILVCHCAPGPCHGDVLAELSDRLNQESL